MRIIIVQLLKILCIGLLVHFLFHTWVTFGFGIDAGPLWAWKEIVIGLLLLCVLGYVCYKKELLIHILRIIEFRRLLGVLIVGIIGTACIHLVLVDGSFTTWAMAMRYDYLGFVLLFLGWGIAYSIGTTRSISFVSRYARVIKWVLIGALIWWCIVAIKPGTLKIFGFNNYVFEGTVGLQPPAVYYTHINDGLPRSQFLFERPTTFGFWLTAFFPLFFLQFLYRRPLKETRGWRVIYGLNIILTFSRAARGSWIIAVIVAIGFTSKLPWKKLLLWYGLPLIVFFGAILRIGREQIALRGYSNYGHMTMLNRGFAMLLEKPLRGWGGASAGPGSHWDGGLAFNPENQFLQILIEFGKIGAIPWLILWFWCVLIGLRRGMSHETLFAFSLGMLTLTISGMVLHSFGDRMVVYPFMLLFGIVAGGSVGKLYTQN